MPYHNLRDNTGKFRSKMPARLVAGRLYGYRGIIVRAGNDRQYSRSNPAEILRHVTCHKVLSGFVPENDLQIVAKDQVKNYLQNA